MSAEFDSEAKTVAYPAQTVSGETTSRTASDDLEVGAIVGGKYKVVELIGKGGMGSVYRVTHVFLSRDFALKTLEASSLSDVKVRRFQQEARAASNLEHPNLVKVHDFGLIGSEQPFLIMDFVQGKTLSSYLKENGPLAVDIAVPLFIQIALGLAYAHEQKVVHRDIKPSNIIWMTPGEQSTEGDVKVVDFGIAKVAQAEEQQALTRTGDVLGSPLYMSPEQCLGTPVDHRSDIYSLGCVFFEALTGLPPFLGDNALATMMKHQQEAPLSLKSATMGGAFSESLENVVARMLAKVPAERYQNLADFVMDLCAMSGGAPSSMPANVKKNQPKVKAEPAAFKKSTLVFVIVSSLAFGSVAGFIAGMQADSKNGKSEPRLPEQAQDAPIALPKMAEFPTCKTVKHKIGTRKFLTMRYFQFPRLTWGLIYSEDDERCAWPASGLVTIPARLNLTWQIPPDVGSEPEVYAGFQGDEFVAITMIDNHLLEDDALKPISKFRTLRSLSVPYSLLTDASIEAINKLDLKVLNIKNTRISTEGVLHLKNLLELTELSFGGPNCNKPVAVLNRLANSQVLRFLAISDSGLEGKDLEPCTRMPALVHLNLSGRTMLGDDSTAYLAKMPNLRRIELESPFISPRSIPHFGKLKKLRMLKLHGVKWKKEDERRLQNLLPECELVVSANPSHPLRGKKSVLRDMFNDSVTPSALP